jgi:hypothetical protein
MRNESSTEIGTGSFDPLFDHGRMYLVCEKRMDKTLGILEDFNYSGAATLCVSRLHPDLIRERMQSGTMEHIWLSERSGDNNISPSQLHRVLQRIGSFLLGRKEPVIFFEGIEYLSSFNDFNKVLMFVEELNDMVMTSGSVLLMPIDPDSFDPRSVARLRRFAEVL